MNSTRFARFAYLVTVRHDRGTARLAVTAANKAGAVAQVMSSEGCPRRAIVAIDRLPADMDPRNRRTLIA